MRKVRYYTTYMSKINKLQHSRNVHSRQSSNREKIIFINYFAFPNSFRDFVFYYTKSTAKDQFLYARYGNVFKIYSIL